MGVLRERQAECHGASALARGVHHPPQCCWPTCGTRHTHTHPLPGGDHLIPWPSSSLRYAHELPTYDLLPWGARGPAVIEDTRPHAPPGVSSGVAGGSSNGSSGGSSDNGTTTVPLARESGTVEGTGAAGGSNGLPFGSEEACGNEGGAAGAPRCMGMRGRLALLQQLEWQRFDVVWPRWALQFFAHNAIQMNGPTAHLGIAVADKIIELVVRQGGGAGGAA